ncbi:hypothetical protein N7532_009452 [Penicillium argentinense]|uniref:Uncharacterized protein n=1 Tax=Penicillium argentinense TaxID=1131581 RepID=A0A9W9EZF3_9EURO|nr:uncharacterized protein N7532_009452 [Penicillium argentinense]KAJ5090768.1 hypothetical protein N7532_009452 [Penicillium argentinense]
MAKKPKTIKLSAKLIVTSIENRAQQLSESAKKAFSNTIELPSQAAGSGQGALIGKDPPSLGSSRDLGW